MKITRRNLLLSSTTVAAANAQKAQKETLARQSARPLQPELPGRRFRGEALREIAFPLGGIGTGTVSLGGYGQLRDWEIFNRPNKNSTLPFTFAALRVAGGGLEQPTVRVLERRVLPPYNGGHGVPRETGIGLPRLSEAIFTGSYPFANIRFIDRKLPVEVSLEAFNPMIPLETDDSSLPVAILTYSVKSRAASDINGTLAFSVMNPVGYDGVTKLRSRRAPFFGGNLNEFRTEGGLSGLLLSSQKYDRESPRYGSVALLTANQDTSYRLEWEHGAWWDEFQKWWDEFLAAGRFPNTPTKASEAGYTEYSTLARHFKLSPGEEQILTFILAWNFPNVENYWSGPKETRPVRNHYGTRWPSAWEPAAYALNNFVRLQTRSKAYRDALYASTLPASVIDAVSSQASIMRTNTVMVMEHKLTLAFEGCNDDSGCCPMNCTHVYNYEQAIAHLYPDLERSMRDTDFLVNLRPDGSMSFRTPVPLQQGGNKNLPAADGQMGCVLKVYREWQLSGNDEWLRKLWPSVKRALEYAWLHWDKDRDGVMEGEQHNTYDIEFYGPNSMMGTLYLGALIAASRMARYLGDAGAASAYHEMVERGRTKLDRELWNGEFYVQKVDKTQEKAAKYQYGEGCLSDQLLGQWFAEVVDLGKVLPHDHIRTALGSIFKYNFRKDMGDFANAQRIYALNDESGVLLCSWPRGKRPALPFVYSDEVWTGIEYQVAAHLIYEGMVKEGVAIVDAVRQRYDGLRRNPWDELECGHHYARAMSSWSLLTALSGFAFSAPEKAIRFRPRVRGADFRCLFSSGTAWGSYSQRVGKEGTEAMISVEGGSLELAQVRIPAAAPKIRLAAPQRASAQIEHGEALIKFEQPVRLNSGDKLRMKLA